MVECNKCYKESLHFSLGINGKFSKNEQILVSKVFMFFKTLASIVKLE